MPRLLIVYHTQTGGTQSLAEAAMRGAAGIPETQTILKRAVELRPSGVAGGARCVPHWADLAVRTAPVTHYRVCYGATTFAAHSTFVEVVLEA
jgi:hypothetical protein